MTWKPGMYCCFTSVMPHPLPNIRKMGKLIELSTPYTQNNERYINYVIEDSYGKWETKQPVVRGEWDLSGLSGFDWSSLDEYLKINKENFQADIEYFRKDVSYFQKLLPSKFNNPLPSTTKVDTAISLLQDPTLHKPELERSLIMMMCRLEKIFKQIAYKYPYTLKTQDTHFYHADHKQGAYYATISTFDDVIYQHELSWQSVKNMRSMHKTFTGNPRNIVSPNRTEELRISILLYGESISNWICNGFSGDEDPIDELEYIDLLKEAGTIVQRAIDIK